MRRRNILFFVFPLAVLFALLVFSMQSCEEANGYPGGELIRHDTAFAENIDTAIAPYVNLEYDMIQFFDRGSLEHFYRAWKQTKERRLSIVHLGDSHLQSDILPGQMRKDLQSIHGDAGRGMIFPYSTANTYSSVEYKSTHTGKWDYAKSLALPPKLPLGVIGMTSRTDDANASFTITFYKPVPETYNRLKIFCKKEHNAYDLLVKTGTKNIAVAVDSSSADTLPYYEVSLPPLSDHITIQLQKNNPYENELEFYGMSLETSENRGLIFHNCGVGGAKYESVLYEDLFEKQLPALNPDLVIIDFGTNDYIYEDSIHPDLDSQIVAVIHRVRNAAPQASIILTSTQDMYRKGHNMVCGEQFADLIRGIARQEHCGLFDWYWISGGRTARLKWNEKGYSQPDMIHLSPRGYRLKANLFADAIVSTYHFLELNTTDDSLVFNMDSLKEVQKKLIVVDSLWNSTDTRGKHMVRHTVRKGESLSRIASHYGVSIVQIKKWNHLNGDIIHVGQVLVIYTNQKPKPKPKPKTKPAPPKK